MSNVSVAPNWKQEIGFEYELFHVTPSFDCKATAARTRGYWATRQIWVEWTTPIKLKGLIETLQTNGYTVEFSNPSKPMEELDMLNTEITARKRSADKAGIGDLGDPITPFPK